MRIIKADDKEWAEKVMGLSFECDNKGFAEARLTGQDDNIDGITRLFKYFIDLEMGLDMEEREEGIKRFTLSYKMPHKKRAGSFILSMGIPPDEEKKKARPKRK